MKVKLQGTTWRRRPALAIGMGIAVSLLLALLVSLVVHAHLFATPSGEFVAASVSPAKLWEARTTEISPPPGGSYVWRVEVRSPRDTGSTWRTVYLGVAGQPPPQGAPRWLSDSTIAVAGQRVDVTGDGYVRGWMTVGEAVFGWLVTIGAALVALALGAVLTVLVFFGIRRPSPVT